MNFDLYKIRMPFFSGLIYYCFFSIKLVGTTEHILEVLRFCFCFCDFCFLFPIFRKVYIYIYTRRPHMHLTVRLYISDMLIIVVHNKLHSCTQPLKFWFENMISIIIVKWLNHVFTILIEINMVLACDVCGYHCSIWYRKHC